MNREQFEQAMKKRYEIMKKYGYIIDATFGYDVELDHDFGKGIFFNTHTHGLKKNFNHPELQIILPLSKEVVTGIINTVVQTFVVNGDGLTDGQVIKDLFNPGYDLLVVLHKQEDEDGHSQEFLRLLIPDEQNKIPTIQEAPDSLYAYQREDIYPASQKNIH